MNLEKAVQLRMDTDGHGFTAFFAGDMIHPEGEPRSVINEVGTEICWRRIRDRYFCSLKAALRVSVLEESKRRPPPARKSTHFVLPSPAWCRRIWPQLMRMKNNFALPAQRQ